MSHLRGGDLGIVRNLVILVTTIWLTVTLTFLLLRVLPGDAVTAQLTQAGASAQAIAATRDQLGLSKPIWEQYRYYISALLRGDMGSSLVNNQPVEYLISQRIQPTLNLTVSAIMIAITAGICIGTLSSYDFLPGYLARGLLYLSISTPIYWTGTLAILIFSVYLGWFPSTGTGRLEHLILPGTVLGFHTMGEIARIVQVKIYEVRNAPFVVTARSKGLSEARILGIHILRVGLMPVVSVTALQIGFLLSGAVITESLFVRPGIGQLLLDSTIHQDYPVVQGVVILSAVSYSILSLLADAIYYTIDPRLHV